MKPVGIYIHVPFCRYKCPYCDFYSVTAKDELLDRFAAETIRRIGELSGEKISADTVYFGGGTPSLLGGGRIAAIMDALRRHVDLADNAEITVEANPTIDLGSFLEGCASSGVNRLSLGMQSAVKSELSAIGRRHTSDDVLRAMEQAHSVGIHNISLDLMLGIPMQTPESLLHSLRFIEASAPSHLSAYMLKIEENTPFYRIQYALKLPDEDTLTEMYTRTFAFLEEAGYAQYEISNAARPGCESRHNLKYWRCEEYVGIGPSAHGFLHGRRYYYDRSLEQYLSGAQPVDDGEGGDIEEYVMLRLRLSEGLNHEDMRARFGADIPRAMLERAASPVMAPYCICDDSGIRLTRRGMLISNAIICELMEHL